MFNLIRAYSYTLMWIWCKQYGIIIHNLGQVQSMTFHWKDLTHFVMGGGGGDNCVMGLQQTNKKRERAEVIYTAYLGL